ncbi:MAG: sigma-70 family RNA polymerase sigma factor [Patescibacteria group bacterium]|nr:sigma-70 family RNA polymerase sigma factor [Patescibacteria group bacterium]
METDFKKTTDEEIIKKYLSGESELFGVLTERYANFIYNFIYQYVKNREQAEDLVQETFLKVWKNLKRFDLTKKFKVWIFKIARNTVIDFFRKKKEINFSDIDKREEEKEYDIPDAGPTPSEIFERKEIQEETKKALSFLPLKYRLTLINYYQDQLNFREIAELNGESINTVKSRYRRAMALLKAGIIQRNPETAQSDLLNRRTKKRG